METWFPIKSIIKNAFFDWHTICDVIFNKFDNNILI
jgi:hypothetical protein